MFDSDSDEAFESPKRKISRPFRSTEASPFKELPFKSVVKVNIGLQKSKNNTESKENHYFVDSDDDDFVIPKKKYGHPFRIIQNTSIDHPKDNVKDPEDLMNDSNFDVPLANLLNIKSKSCLASSTTSEITQTNEDIPDNEDSDDDFTIPKKKCNIPLSLQNNEKALTPKINDIDDAKENVDLMKDKSKVESRSDRLVNAMEMVKSGVSINQAARDCNIPKTTLYDNLRRQNIIAIRNELRLRCKIEGCGLHFPTITAVYKHFESAHSIILQHRKHLIAEEEECHSLRFYKINKKLQEEVIKILDQDLLELDANYIPGSYSTYDISKHFEKCDQMQNEKGYHFQRKSKLKKLGYEMHLMDKKYKGYNVLFYVSKVDEGAKGCVKSYLCCYPKCKIAVNHRNPSKEIYFCNLHNHAEYTAKLILSDDIPQKVFFRIENKTNVSWLLTKDIKNVLTKLDSLTLHFEEEGIHLFRSIMDNAIALMCGVLNNLEKDALTFDKSTLAAHRNSGKQTIKILKNAGMSIEFIPKEDLPLHEYHKLTKEINDMKTKPESVKEIPNFYMEMSLLAGECYTGSTKHAESLSKRGHDTMLYKFENELKRKMDATAKLYTKRYQHFEALAQIILPIGAALELGFNIHGTKIQTDKITPINKQVKLPQGFKLVPNGHEWNVVCMFLLGGIIKINCNEDTFNMMTDMYGYVCQNIVTNTEVFEDSALFISNEELEELKADKECEEEAQEAEESEDENNNEPKPQSIIILKLMDGEYVSLSRSKVEVENLETIFIKSCSAVEQGIINLSYYLLSAILHIEGYPINHEIKRIKMSNKLLEIVIKILERMQISYSFKSVKKLQEEYNKQEAVHLQSIRDKLSQKTEIFENVYTNRMEKQFVYLCYTLYAVLKNEEWLQIPLVYLGGKKSMKRSNSTSGKNENSGVISKNKLKKLTNVDLNKILLLVCKDEEEVKKRESNGIFLHALASAIGDVPQFNFEKQRFYKSTTSLVNERLESPLIYTPYKQNFDVDYLQETCLFYFNKGIYFNLPTMLDGETKIEFTLRMLDLLTKILKEGNFIEEIHKELNYDILKEQSYYEVPSLDIRD